ncbi:MAG: alkaline phosphatase [Bacteroidales bacterium]|nr:alkaline phosphatase [Bacteroidales bacterium]
MKVLKFILIFVLGIALIGCVHKKEECHTVKNVIILIPDGTSVGLVTLSRWYNDNNPLAIDPYICGLIKTHNSDGKFPDSAPTSTAYATGVKTKSPYVGLNCNAEPRASVLELAKRKGLATGIVATCEFPHATPADFVCHFNSRESRDYKNLAKQFIYNSPNLVFAGGKKYLDENGYYDLLEPNRIKLITNKDSFELLNTLSDTCLWALFPDWQDSTRNMSYECDRNNAKAPGLSEMTDKAIKLLSQNKNGFFLMVEGSQIDWAAHGNDPYAAVNDFLEFDKAVAVALKFAKEDKNTVVIICPDHGTGGISIGNQLSGTEFIAKNPTKYDNIDIKEKIIDPLKKIEWSSRKLAEMMLRNPAYISKDSLKKYYNTYPTDDFVNILKNVTTKNNIDTLQYLIGGYFSRNNFIGWTTTGHTAEDVFLAIYAPENVKKISGTVSNHEIGKYIAEILKLDDFDTATKDLYTKHSEYFNKDEIIFLNSDSLVVKKNGKELIFEANSKVIKINGEREKLPSMVIWIDGIYYLPKETTNYFK